MNARTRIIKAFRQLVLEQPYQTISVNGICAAAGVSKKTFYSSFETRDALISETIDFDFFDPPRKLHRNMYSSMLVESSVMITSLFYETFLAQRQFYEELMRNIGRNELRSRLVTCSFRAASEIFSITDEMTDDDLLEREYFLMLQSTTSVDSLLWWNDRGYQPNPVEMAALYEKWNYAYLRSHTVLKNMSLGSARKE